MGGVLLLGLVLAQLLSLGIDALDRGRAFYRSTTLQMAEQIANIAKSLDAVGPEARTQIVGRLSDSHLTIALSRGPDLPESVPEKSYARAFRVVLKGKLGPNWPVRVLVYHVRRPAGSSGGFFGDAPVNAFDRYLTFRLFSLAPRGFAFVAQIRLHDGSEVTFAAPLPYEHITRLYVLLPKLLLMLAIVMALLLLAVRRVTRPLKNMARAALALGQQLNRRPLEESGPDEIRSTARALNVMQLRLQEYVRDRAAMLATLSHDFKTFITRLRLRTELLPDSRHRDRLIADLADMATMVNVTLDYLHGINPDQHRAPFDVTALVESVRIDAEDMGWTVAVCGAAGEPFSGNAQDLRRCVMNLVENAVKYGGRATISLEDRPDELTIAVSDPGPGVPPAEEERVFEPFYRGESSRGRDLAGTGLGLNIARTIARAHGGDVVLKRETPLGFCFAVCLPRCAAPTRPRP
jgi:signal transduction histidine kinase